jgi:hypothetical protein
MISIRGLLRTTSPAFQAWENVSKERPDEGQVGDENGDGSFSEIPVHVDIGNKVRNQAINFGQDGGDYDESTHSKQKD